MKAPLFRLLSRDEFNALSLTQKRIYLGVLIAELLDKLAEADLRPVDASPAPGGR